MRPTRFSLLACTILLAACARDLSQNTYVSSDTVGKVVRGQIVHVEAVTIRDQDDAEGNFGALGGAATGGVAGSAAGDGTGQALATVGGAIAGAVIGSLIENELSTQQGFQYVVQLNAPARTPAADRIRRQEDRTVRVGASVEDDLKQSIGVSETESDMISVIQADASPLPVGSAVLVIYHDDRPRIILDKSR